MTFCNFLSPTKRPHGRKAYMWAGWSINMEPKNDDSTSTEEYPHAIIKDINSTWDTEKRVLFSVVPSNFGIGVEGKKYVILSTEWLCKRANGKIETLEEDITLYQGDSLSYVCSSEFYDRLVKLLEEFGKKTEN